MKIGIVIAIAREICSFLESDYKIDIIKHRNYEVYHCKVNNNDVYACKSGYGKVDAAAATQMLISVFDVEVILNYGVTGAVDRAIKPEDLFVVTGAVNKDYDVSHIDPVKKHQYEEFDDIFIPLDRTLIDLAKKIRPDLCECKAATGDNFVFETEEKLYINSLGAQICDMEIVAIAKVCYFNNVKCLSIKCISDAFDGDGSDFAKNVRNAGAKAFALIKELLLEL